MAYRISTEPTEAHGRFDFEPKRKPLLFLSKGHRIDEASWVSHSAVQRDRKKIAPIMGISTEFGVREDIKEIIEELEPNVHQFFEVQLKRKDGTPYQERYFVLNIAQQFPSIVLAEPDKERWVSYGTTFYPWRPMPIEPEHEHYVSRPKVAGRHLWISQIVYPHDAFCSDELLKRIAEHLDVKITPATLKRAKSNLWTGLVKYWKTEPVPETDEP
ncbi:MAG: DUF1629 domain-containing protein [Pseudomonadota bacterium]